MRTHKDPTGPDAGRRGGRSFIPRTVVVAFEATILLVGMTGGVCAQSFNSFQADQEIVLGVVATGASSSGSITVDAATGGVTTRGGITFFGGTVMPARFSGQGHGTAQHCTVTLVLPESATVSSGGRTATLSHFTLSPASIRLSGTRRFTFQVGATLSVPAGLPGGAYSGTITATAIFTDC